MHVSGRPPCAHKHALQSICQLMPLKCVVTYKNLLWTALVRVNEACMEKEHVMDHLRVCGLMQHVLARSGMCGIFHNSVNMI